MATRILILGSTGSIGCQALDVIARSQGQLQVVGLAAESSWETLLKQAAQFNVDHLALSSYEMAQEATRHWGGPAILSGSHAAMQLVLEVEADIVLNAVVGFAGLASSVATVGEGIDLALANKESLVTGGELLMQLAQATESKILPVDSEHSALHQLLIEQPPGTVEHITLTASGGPFIDHSQAELETVTVDQALAHPTWQMGGKISIDSATLMNKGLEVIEAHQLFGVSYEQINVVTHPQSIVHATIALNDGSTFAHLGYPDMRVPISYALYRGERVDTTVEPLDLARLGALHFQQPDTARFRCLDLAYEAGKAGGNAPCLLNAANEVAVEAFLAGRIRFLAIPEAVENVLDEVEIEPVYGFDALDHADQTARRIAREYVNSSTIKQ